ncbi:MAG TPA: hypothetical protein VMV27_08320 [Candidatus Binataceae bacterium]|nr:hypothetical protein [Candidatus Binataceae bacterium]
MSDATFDAVIIGSGRNGMVLAAYPAKAGGSVGLIDPGNMLDHRPGLIPSGVGTWQFVVVGARALARFLSCAAVIGTKFIV